MFGQSRQHREKVAITQHALPYVGGLDLVRKYRQFSVVVVEFIDLVSANPLDSVPRYFRVGRSNVAYQRIFIDREASIRKRHA